MPSVFDQRVVQKSGVQLMLHHVCALQQSKTEASELIASNNQVNGQKPFVGRTLRRWFNFFMDYGRLPCEGMGSLRERGDNDSRGSWTEEETRILKEWLERDPTLYLDELVSRLVADGFSKRSRSGISKHLHLIGWSRKVVHEKASQRVEADRQDFLLQLRMDGDCKEQFLWLDETNKGRDSAKRKRGWSEIGERASYFSSFDTKVQYTLIACADCFGFVPELCETFVHRRDGKEVLKPLDKEAFTDYFARVVAPRLGNFLRNEKHSILVMDNCSVHMDPEIARLVREAGAKIIYSAPYSPDLIPIEGMFSKYKAFLRRHRNVFGGWETTHAHALASVSPEDGLGFFRMSWLLHLLPQKSTCSDDMDVETLEYLQEYFDNY